MEYSFYKQVRNDGGVRAGITINDDTAWMHFKPGSDTDPALLWYATVEISGKSLNDDAEEAREAFRKYADIIKATLDSVAAALKADGGYLVWPMSSGEIKLAPGLRLKVTCSAIRRLLAQSLADEIQKLRDRWIQHLEELELTGSAAQSA